MMALDGLDFLRSDVRVLRAEVQHDWTAWFFCGVLSDSPAVITDSRGWIEPRCSKPGETSAKTITNHADFSRRQLLPAVIDGCSNVQQSFFHPNLSGDAHSLLRVSGVIAEFDTSPYAIEECRRNRHETLCGVVIRHGPYV